MILRFIIDIININNTLVNFKFTYQKNNKHHEVLQVRL